MQLDGKVALITGAGSGIGKAAALLLAREGAKIAALDMKEEDAQQTVQEIERAGGTARAVAADVSQPDAMQQAVQQVVDAWDRLDIVFANAGINGVWAPLEELTPEDWDKTLGINLKGTFLTVKYAVPHLKKRGGSVIVTASVNGTRIFSNTGATAYSSSKAGQVRSPKWSRWSWPRRRCGSTSFVRGPSRRTSRRAPRSGTWTKCGSRSSTPKGREPLEGGTPGTADQVARLVLFLASDASEHITGTEIWIDGRGVPAARIARPRRRRVPLVGPIGRSLRSAQPGTLAVAAGVRQGACRLLDRLGDRRELVAPRPRPGTDSRACG